MNCVNSKCIMEKSFENGEKRRCKKRKSFLKVMKNQAKKGKFGRGTSLDGDTYNYFCNVLGVRVEDFTSEKDKSIYVNNVFETTNGREIEVSCNQLGCRVYEKLLPMADVKTLLCLADKLSKDLRKIILHEFGGFVLQQLFVSVVAMIEKHDGSRREDESKTQPSKDGKNVESDEEEDDVESKSPSPNEIIQMKSWVEKVAKFAINNVAEFIWHLGANPILRTILECLSGLPLGSTSKGKKMQNKASVEIESCPMSEGSAFVQECGQLMLQYDQIVDCVYERLTSGFLQTLLYALKKIDKKLHKKLITHLLKKCYNCQGTKGNVQNQECPKPKDSLPDVLENVPATRLLDAMIETGGPKSWSNIYNQCFANRITLLSNSSNGNFCLQNLIKQCRKKDQFEPIFDETVKHFKQFLSNNRMGIICAVAEACQRLSTRQGEFFKGLQIALQCSDKKECAMFPILVAYLVNYESWTKNEELKNEMKVSLHGSLILQTMLKFAETIKIINGLLQVDSKHLKSMFCDMRGCFIADAYFGSKSVGDKSREKMVRKLQGSYVELACSKYGSRAFDAIWNWSPLSSRKLILQEIVPKTAVLKSVEWGYFIFNNTGLELFNRNEKDWEESQRKKTQTLKSFADLIG